MSGDLAPVIALDRRRRMACPHCDVVFQLRYLISHLEFDECPVLMAKRTPEPVA